MSAVLFYVSAEKPFGGFYGRWNLRGFGKGSLRRACLRICGRKLVYGRFSYIFIILM